MEGVHLEEAFEFYLNTFHFAYLNIHRFCCMTENGTNLRKIIGLHSKDHFVRFWQALHAIAAYFHVLKFCTKTGERRKQSQS
jgi:hypothetical protein